MLTKQPVRFSFKSDKIRAAGPADYCHLDTDSFATNNVSVQPPSTSVTAWIDTSFNWDDPPDQLPKNSQ